MLTLGADEARERYRRIRARFASEPPRIDANGTQVVQQRGRDVELLVTGDVTEAIERLRQHSVETLEHDALSLEEIFVSAVRTDRVPA